MNRDGHRVASHASQRLGCPRPRARAPRRGVWFAVGGIFIGFGLGCERSAPTRATVPPAITVSAASPTSHGEPGAAPRGEPWPRIDTSSELLTDTGDPDRDLLLALFFHRYLGVSKRAREVMIAIRRARVSDPKLEVLRDGCVESWQQITPERTLGDHDGEGYRRCYAEVLKLVTERGWRPADESAIADRLAAESTISDDRPFLGAGDCHRMQLEMSPHAREYQKLQRPDGVKPGERVDILIRIAKDGRHRLRAVLNADDSAKARACFAAVDGPWRPARVSNEQDDEVPVDACHIVSCRF